MRKFSMLALATMLLIAGNALGQGAVLPLPDADQKEIIALLGPGVVGQALPNKTI